MVSRIFITFSLYIGGERERERERGNNKYLNSNDFLSIQTNVQKKRRTVVDLP